MPEKEGAEEKKTTKEVVNKKQKQILNQEDYIPEEGYDVARDEGRVSPTKDKKDATTAPRKPMSAKERKKSMQQAQQRSQIAVNNVVTALRKKYGKDAVMYTQKTSKAKSNEELDLSQVAEAFGGYVIDENVLDDIKKFGSRISSAVRTTMMPKGVASKKAKENISRTIEKETGKKAKFYTKKGKITTAADFDNADDVIRIGKEKQIPQDKIGVAPGEKPRKVTSYKIGDKPPESQVEKSRKLVAKKKLQKDMMSRASGTTKAGRKPLGSTYRVKEKDFVQARKKLKTDSLIKNVKATPQKAVSASQKIGKAVAKPLTKAADATKVVGSTAQGLGKIANQGVVQPTFKALRQTGLGKSGATVADMGKTAVGKVSKGLSVGNLKTVGKTVGKRAFGKGGALAAKTIGRAGAKFGAKRIYGVGSAIAGAEAIGRFATGDIVGGTLAGAEAITGLIPGLGTGVSAGLGAVGLARDLRRTKKAVQIARKLKPTKFKAMRGAIASTKQSNKFVKGLVKPQNRTSTAIGLAGAGTVGSNVGDRRRNRFRLPNIPAPSLTGGSAGFRSAG